MRQTTTTTSLTPAAPNTTPAPTNPPVGAYDLTTLQVAKDELRILTANTSDDVWLQRAITRGSAAISKYCNRVFSTETIQDIIYPQQDPYPDQVPGGNAPLQLSRYPVQSIVSLTINMGLSDPAHALTLGTNYMLDGAKGELIRLSQWSTFPIAWECAPITVRYVAGYATVPPDLEQAILLWLASAYQSRSRDPLLRMETQPTLGTREYWVSGTPEAHFPPSIQDLLDEYREVTVQ